MQEFSYRNGKRRNNFLRIGILEFKIEEKIANLNVILIYGMANTNMELFLNRNL